MYRSYFQRWRWWRGVGGDEAKVLIFLFYWRPRPRFGFDFVHKDVGWIIILCLIRLSAELQVSLEDIFPDFWESFIYDIVFLSPFWVLAVAVRFFNFPEYFCARLLLNYVAEWTHPWVSPDFLMRLTENETSNGLSTLFFPCRIESTPQASQSV